MLVKKRGDKMNKDYQNFVDRMGSFDNDVDDIMEKPMDSLQHVGILGMKWGKRKASAVESPKSDDHILTTGLRTKKINSLSNAELKKLNERLQLERNYKELVKRDVSPGQRIATEILVNSAKQTASTYVSKYMSKGVDYLISGKAFKSKS